MATKTQEISKKDLKVVYSQICESWQNKLKDIILWSEGNKVEISQELIESGYKEANTEQKKLIEKYFKISKPEDICSRIQDWDDILEINEIDNYKDPILKPKTKEEKSINALSRMFLIAKAYNGDWISDWKNTKEYKWFPYKNYSGGSYSLAAHCWVWDCGVPSGAYLKEKKYCEDIIRKFKDVIDDYFMI